MGLYDNASFPAPDFSMGDSGGRLLDHYLNYRDVEHQKRRQEAENDIKLRKYDFDVDHMRQMAEQAYMSQNQNMAPMGTPQPQVDAGNFLGRRVKPSKLGQYNEVGVRQVGSGDGLVPPPVVDPMPVRPPQMQNQPQIDIRPSSTGGPGGTGMNVLPPQYPAGYNPNDPFGWQKADQIKEAQKLDQQKLALLQDKQEDKNVIDQRTVGVKERLASLKDMTDSQKAALLQQGKVTLQEIRDADAMKRTEANIEGRKDVVNTQGDQRMNEIKAKGNLEHSYITERGDQARLTKGAPSGTPQTPAQQKVAMQSRAAQLISQNPAMSGVISFNDQGFPVISPDADPELQSEAYRTIFSSSITSPVGTPAPTGKDTNLSLPKTDAKFPESLATTPYKPNVPQMTDSFSPNVAPTKPDAASAANTTGGQGTIKQYSASRNQTRISTDGGKTWKILPGKQ